MEWGPGLGWGRAGGEDGQRSIPQGPEQVRGKEEEEEEAGSTKPGGRVWVFYTYGGATSSSGTSRAARTCFTLRGRDKRLRSEK